MVFVCVNNSSVYVLQGVTALAGTEGGNQEAEVREDQREENVDARRGVVQGNN